MMKRFKVLVEGRCYFVKHLQRKMPYGFFTTFYVDVYSMKSINKILGVMLSTRLHENNIVLENNFFVPSYSIVDSVCLVDNLVLDEKTDGFTFYKLDFLTTIIFIAKYYFFRVFYIDKLIV